MARSRARIAREVHGFLTRDVKDVGTATSGALAAAVLDDLSLITTCDCTMLTTSDAASRRITTVANHDYPDHLLRVAESQMFINRHLSLMATGSRIPLRRRENPSQQRSSEDMMRPWGFHDGFGMALWARDGRWVGKLIGSTLRTSGVDDEAIDLLALLAPSLALLLDPLPHPRSSGAELARGDAEGFVVNRAGRTRALTAGADPDLARRGGPLWPMIHSVLEGPDRWRSATVLLGSHVLAVSAEADRHGALVLHRRIPAPYGLSVRELEILDAVSEGATNRALAARFAITPRTVATYVERILIKTGCPNRTAAARLAAHLNLVVVEGRASLDEAGLVRPV